jgi:hypothetical protein
MAETFNTLCNYAKGANIGYILKVAGAMLDKRVDLFSSILKKKEAVRESSLFFI